MENNVHYKSITEISKLIKNKSISPVELTKYIFERIDKLDNVYKSFITLMKEDALYSAINIEKEIYNGNYKGYLHGIPIALKDLVFTKGIPTMGGCKVLIDHIPSFDATVVNKLKASGAIILGKLNLTEAAVGGYNPEFDIPRNPWGIEYYTGGSSSGSAVATSLGLCFASLGSDTGGSIRFPSASCGVVGLKPTWGRVSRYGLLDLAPSLDHLGPITREVEDAAIVFDSIAGYDVYDPTSLNETVPDTLPYIDKGIDGMKIGLDEKYISDNVDSEIVESVFNCINILQKHGAEIVKVKMPELKDYLPAWNIICSTEASIAHKDNYPSRKNDYGGWFRTWLENGNNYSAIDYANANFLRIELNSIIKNVFSNIDVLICPSMTKLPHKIDEAVLYGDYVKRDTYFGKFTQPFDFNGAPTLSIPSGFSKSGLPLSVQFVGKHLQELKLFQVGKLYESNTEWHNINPVIISGE